MKKTEKICKTSKGKKKKYFVGWERVKKYVGQPKVKKKKKYFWLKKTDKKCRTFKGKKKKIFLFEKEWKNLKDI